MLNCTSFTLCNNWPCDRQNSHVTDLGVSDVLPTCCHDNMESVVFQLHTQLKWLNFKFLMYTYTSNDYGTSLNDWSLRKVHQIIESVLFSTAVLIWNQCIFHIIFSFPVINIEPEFYYFSSVNNILKIIIFMIFVFLHIGIGVWNWNYEVLTSSLELK